MSDGPASPATPNTDALLREVLARLERIEAALTPRRMPPRSKGRKRLDDADALAEVRSLIGQGLDEWAALRSVATNLGGNVGAHRQRLKRKLHEGS